MGLRVISLPQRFFRPSQVRDEYTLWMLLYWKSRGQFGEIPCFASVASLPSSPIPSPVNIFWCVGGGKGANSPGGSCGPHLHFLSREAIVLPISMSSIPLAAVALGLYQVFIQGPSLFGSHLPFQTFLSLCTPASIVALPESSLSTPPPLGSHQHACCLSFSSLPS